MARRRHWRSRATRTTATTSARPGPTAAFLLKHIGGAGRRCSSAPGPGSAFLGDGRRALAALAENHYLATDELAARLGLGDRVRESLRAELRALGRQGRLRDAGRADRARLPADQPGRRGRGVPPHRRHRGGDRGGPGAQRHPVRPGPGRRCSAQQAPELFADLDVGEQLGPGDRRRAGAGPGAARRAARRCARGDRRVRRAQVAVADRPLPRRRRPRGASAAARYGLARATRPRCVGRRWCTTSAASGCRTRSGTSPAPLTAAEIERVRLHPVPDRADAGVLAGARAARRDRGPAPRAARRLRLSARPLRRGDHAGGPHPGRGRRLPRADRAAAAPAGSLSAGRGRARCAPR